MIHRVGKVITLFVLLILVVGCFPGEGGVSASIVGKSMKDSAGKISFGIDRATANSDYLLEKNLRTLQIMSNNLSHQLSVETAKNRSFVSQELSNSFTKLNELVEDAQGGILDIQDFIVLDTTSVINQLPLKTDIYVIRRIKGYGVQYKNEGEYEFEIIGNAFNPTNKYRVEINNKQVDVNNIHSPVANTLFFTVPVSLLNGTFEDSSVVRVELKMESIKDDDVIFTYDGNVILLPKLPVTYNLTDKFKKDVWVAQTGVKRYGKPMGPTGEEGVWHKHALSASIENPLTQRFSKVVNQGTDGSHSYCRGGIITDNGKKINVNCANQCHDCTRNGYVELSYEELSYVEDQRSLLFTSDAESKHLLTYGTHFSRLDPNNQSWTLEVKFFNGKLITLHPQKLMDTGVRAYLDTDQDSDFKQLILEIDDPNFG
ncbi:hypothetical protein [Vibrio splendidus]|uniref:hypothetical protein n=1 Tax=Vibrio splendidus TaxID=29497 RepID=UPI002468EAA4|nr:hypothetical protein [Vibrio splendidus]MDH5886533.1 hypothetical protein [Vibrio splendidus]